MRCIENRCNHSHWVVLLLVVRVARCVGQVVFVAGALCNNCPQRPRGQGHELQCIGVDLVGLGTGSPDSRVHCSLTHWLWQQVFGHGFHFVDLEGLGSSCCSLSRVMQTKTLA